MVGKLALSDTTWGSNVRKLKDNDAPLGVSPRFVVVDQSYDAEGRRTINEATLVELSVVLRPAYEGGVARDWVEADEMPAEIQPPTYGEVLRRVLWAY